MTAPPPAPSLTPSPPSDAIAGEALGAMLLHALAPLCLLVVVAPFVYWFFRVTWARLDVEAHEARRAGEAFDPRPAVAFAICAASLTVQQYYGGADAFERTIYPALTHVATRMPGLRVELFYELYSFAWWALVRAFGFVVLPFAAWKACFPRDSLLDFGLRPRDVRAHAGTYALCLALVAPCVIIASERPDFAAYYPFYQLASRSRFDLLAWELLYASQFFCLEVFFRGFLINATRARLGSSAVFAAALPYTMIHFGKPYLEVHGALIAGVVLGSLAARTRAIYAGFVAHFAVAFAMDCLALRARGGLPHAWLPW